MRELSRAFTDETLAAFKGELLESRLRVPAPPRPGSPMPEGAEPVSAGFLAGRDSEDKRGMLAFTGDDALLAWHGYGIDTVEMSVPELCAKALEAGMESVIINPSGPSGALIRKEAMGELVPPVPQTVAKKQDLPTGGSITLAHPRMAPSTAVMSVLRAEASKFPQIRAAYMVDGSINGAPARSMAAVLLDDGVLPDSVLPRFIDAVTGKVGASKMPDVLPLDEADPLTQVSREQGMEVYFRPQKKP